MKLGVNLSFVRNDTHTGVGKYVDDLFSGFQSLGKLENCCIFVHESFYLKAKERFSPAKIIVLKNNFFVNFIKRLSPGLGKYLEGQYISGFLLNRTVRKQNLDVMLDIFANHYSLSFQSRVSTVSVIHDVNYKRFPDNYSKTAFKILDFKYKKILREAAQIVAISEFTKEDLMRFFNIIKPIEIIVNPVESNRMNSGENVIGGNYILCTNAQILHKNHITLLEAFNLIKDQVAHKLVLVGAQHNATNLIHSYIDANDLRSRVIMLSQIPDEMLNGLLDHADLFVTPSLSEGFGRTPVEAAMHEIPVISSRETSLPEATMNLVNYYEPACSSQALAEKIYTVLTNPPTRDELHGISMMLKAKYDKVKIAQEYYELCENIWNKRKTVDH